MPPTAAVTNTPEIFLQTGMFGLAFFLIIYITKTQSELMLKIINSLERNTSVLDKLTVLVENIKDKN